MRAVCLFEEGRIDNLTLVPDFPDPAMKPGEVLVRVRATSLNYHDVFTCRGMPGVKQKFPHIIGMDYAGDVVALSDGVTGWKVGDRVLIDPLDRTKGLHGAMIEGGCAELCTVRPAQLVRMPDSVTYEEAASLPIAYGTAYRMMVARAKVAKGDKVLILGASGGVGTCCVMLAKMLGAEVISCGSTPEKLKALTDLGSDKVINYATENFVTRIWELYGKPHRLGTTTGIDVVVNFTGGDTWVDSMKVLKHGGRMVTCGATAGFDPKEDIRFIWSFELNILGSNAWEPDDLVQLMRLVGEGKMKPLISKVLPLEETARGIKMLEDREVIGKVVITL